MKPILLISTLWLILIVTPAGAVEDTPTLPITLSTDTTALLFEDLDPNLQSALEKRLRQNKTWQKLIDRKLMAVALVDLSDPENPRYASVNGRRTMYSASMPKIGILLAAFQQIEDGKLLMTEEVKTDLTDMIRWSSNGAATRMINRSGGLDAVNEVLTDPRYRLYDKSLGGGLWVGKRYQKMGRRVPDPVYGISHGASVMQVARFYYLLATGRLVNPERSKQMLDILVDPGINHKFVAALTKTAPEAKIYRKSGTWRHYHADSALVWGPVWRRYILVGVVESELGSTILTALVPAIESILPHEQL